MRQHLLSLGKGAPKDWRAKGVRCSVCTQRAVVPHWRELVGQNSLGGTTKITRRCLSVTLFGGQGAGRAAFACLWHQSGLKGFAIIRQAGLKFR